MFWSSYGLATNIYMFGFENREDKKISTKMLHKNKESTSINKELDLVSIISLLPNTSLNSSGFLVGCVFSTRWETSYSKRLHQTIENVNQMNFLTHKYPHSSPVRGLFSFSFLVFQIISGATLPSILNKAYQQSLTP